VLVEDEVGGHLSQRAGEEHELALAVRGVEPLEVARERRDCRVDDRQDGPQRVVGGCPLLAAHV
jgi:hypothetical protein